MINSCHAGVHVYVLSAPTSMSYDLHQISVAYSKRPFAYRVRIDFSIKTGRRAMNKKEHASISEILELDHLLPINVQVVEFDNNINKTVLKSKEFKSCVDTGSPYFENEANSDIEKSPSFSSC